MALLRHLRRAGRSLHLLDLINDTLDYNKVNVASVVGQAVPPAIAS